MVCIVAIDAPKFIRSQFCLQFHFYHHVAIMLSNHSTPVHHMSTCSKPPYTNSYYLLNPAVTSVYINNNITAPLANCFVRKLTSIIMSPKRRSSSRLVVKTTKQVVKETVEVSVVRSKKRQKKVNDDEQQEPVESTIAFETKKENQTEKIEVSVEKDPAKRAIESQEETQIAEEDKEPEEIRTIPVEVPGMETPEKLRGATLSVDKDEEPKEPSTVLDDKEPVSNDVVTETQLDSDETQNFEEDGEQARTISMDSQEGSETQNFEETPMTPYDANLC